MCSLSLVWIFLKVLQEKNTTCTTSGLSTIKRNTLLASLFVHVRLCVCLHKYFTPIYMCTPFFCNSEIFHPIFVKIEHCMGKCVIHGRILNETHSAKYPFCNIPVRWIYENKRGLTDFGKQNNWNFIFLFIKYFLILIVLSMIQLVSTYIHKGKLTPTFQHCFSSKF